MIHAAVLTLVNLVAHFIPFERASLSLDDLARLISSKWSLQFFLAEMRGSLDYPLNIFHNVIVMIAGNEPLLRISFGFVSSSLVTIGIYFLLKELLEDESVAFLGALLYNLLPNKLALFHTLEYTYIHCALILYVLSFFFFIRFLKKDRTGLLWASVTCYTVAIFWYLLGFFLPVVFLGYSLLFYPRKMRWVSAFLIPMAAYLAWRFDLWGLAPQGKDTKAYDLQLHQTLANLFGMVPNLYVGRQMAKAVLYGVYRFFSVPFPWLTLLITADFGLLYGFGRWLRSRALRPLDLKILTLGIASFLLLLAPALLTWGVMDRHTSLSSIGFVLLLLWGITRWPDVQRPVILIMLAGGLVISQGTAWSQVVASRMNRAIYETLRERRQEILEADRVLIDQYSFSSRIHYTWAQDAHNQMDTYWGVQGLLGRGNPFLVHWAVGKKKEVEVVRSPIEVSGEELRFLVYNLNTYSLEQKTVPRKGTVLIDYIAVYPKGFQEKSRAGLRQ